MTILLLKAICRYYVYDDFPNFECGPANRLELVIENKVVQLNELIFLFARQKKDNEYCFLFISLQNKVRTQQREK
jgi:hypothetical protein